jgi:hypothetical protein
MKALFATIKKAPRQRTLTRDGDYRSRRITATVIRTFSRRVRAFSETLSDKSKRTIKNLLSVRLGSGPRRPPPYLALSSVPPQKEVPLVYMMEAS